ncbi:MAG: FAD-dependent thymidylate synthase [Geothermobacteraceae bacterium]
MRVQLLTHTPEPERACAAAARLCYSAADIDRLMARNDEDHAALLQKIVRLGHYSVLEHASFTFGIEGISRACSHQLVRHRIASFSQQSQRYVASCDQFEHVLPESIADRPECRQLFDDFIAEAGRVYRRLLEAGVPAEDARFVLPNAAATKLVMTMNARELRHFFALRCCRRAQWEIRAMACEMLRLVRKVAPVIFGDAGPGCLTGPCPEGAMTCGAIKEVRDEFSQI